MPAQVEKQVAGSGAGLTWTAAFGAEILSLPTANTAVLSSVLIDNSVALDLYADLSLVFTGAAGSPWGFGCYTWFFLFPLNQDGTTYGSGRYSTTPVTGLPGPPRQYFCGGLAFKQGVAATPQYGVVTGILLPPRKFKFVAWNPQGPPCPVWPAANANIYYRTYNRVVA